MTKDILQFFPLNSNGEVKGLFETPLSQRPWSDQVKKSIHGVSYTKFYDANDVKLSEKNTLLDMFHGWCKDFMFYFYKKNPDWTPCLLRRDGFYQSLVHAFCFKILEDGRILFADARGITDNCLDFFDDFKFSKNNMQLIYPKDIKDVVINNYDDCVRAYKHIFGDN